MTQRVDPKLISEYIVVTVTLENRGIFAKPIDEFTFSKLVNDKIKTCIFFLFHLANIRKRKPFSKVYYGS